MKSTSWYQRIERWEPLILSILLVAVGIGIVSRVATDPSGWDWVVFCLWLVAMLLNGGSAISRRRHLGRWFTKPVLATGEVPAADVQSAVEATDNRIAATKALRELHPGLNLVAAAGLVNDLMDRDQQS